MSTRKKRYTLKDFHQEAARRVGELPHIDKLHVSISWWAHRDESDVEFQLVAYTDLLDADGKDRENIKGEGPTPLIAIEDALNSYNAAFGEPASATITVI